jgi:hypothetical protein
MQQAPSYRTLSGIGDEAFEYGFSESGADGAAVMVMYRGSIVAVTLIGAKVSTDVALRQVPELARAIVANIK